MTIRFRDVHTDPPGTEIRRTSEHAHRPRRRSATRAGLAGLLIAGALLVGGCKGEHRSDEPAKRVNAPAPESKAPSSTETTSPGPPEDMASPRHDGKVNADEDASLPASRPPTATEAVADKQVSKLEETADEAPTLDEVLERHGDELRGIRGVVGVAGAECNGAPCIRITVARRTQALLSQLPSSVEGYPVSVVENRGGH